MDGSTSTDFNQRCKKIKDFSPSLCTKVDYFLLETENSTSLSALYFKPGKKKNPRSGLMLLFFFKKRALHMSLWSLVFVVFHAFFIFYFGCLTLPPLCVFCFQEFRNKWFSNHISVLYNITGNFL